MKKSQVKACRPEGSPFRAQANEMQDFTRSTSVQREKYKILFKPHPMTILKSLHNPVVKAFPNTISFQRCFPSVGRSSACPSSSDVPMQNPASPTFRRQRCNIALPSSFDDFFTPVPNVEGFSICRSLRRQCATSGLAYHPAYDR